MPPSKQVSQCDDTKAALKAIVDESLKYPEKKKEFVAEGSIELIIGLCDIRSIPWSLGTYCAAALRILAHGDNKVKAKIVGRGGLPALLQLCDAAELQSDEIGPSEDTQWRFLAHEQAAAVLHILSHQNQSCQAEMVSIGTIKHVVKLCDMFNTSGSHSNCCQSVNQCSQEASVLFHDLTFEKKLVGKVKELSLQALREKAVNLIRTGLVSGFTEVNRIYCVDLYDTTMDYQDIQISNKLIKSQLMWPDMSASDSDDAEDQGKYVKHKDGDRWADVCVTEVIDACHFWAHVGGKLVTEKVQSINSRLLSLEQISLSSIPEPGTFVFVSEIIGGHRDCYRAQVLSTGHAAHGGLIAHLFAVDNGFTRNVPCDCLYVLPEDLLDIAPLATLCCLSGVQVPPKSAEVLEHAAGVLRNLTQESNTYRRYVAAQNGVDVLVKLCMIPNREVCKQALGAILNLAVDTKVRARIGFLGGIQVLLDVCQRFLHDEEILLLALGGIQNLVWRSSESYVNRCRLADSDGLIILSQIYDTSSNETVKASCLRAIKNLLGSSIGALENGVLELTKTPVPTYKSFDTRSIMGERKKFSLSVSDDDPPCHRRRRKRRLRRGEVEPKPTLVALSPGNSGKRSSTGESEGLSDNENSTSYDETDGDTDGERLVTGNPVSVSGTGDDTDVDREQYYIQGYHVPFNEDDLHDFRPQTNVHNLSSRQVARSICAFLNSGKCGSVYLGIRHDGVVAGLKIDRKQRDQLRLGVDEIMDRFNPSVKHHIYEVHFIPVVRRKGSESPTSRVQVEDRFVVEIRIVNCPGLVYMAPGGKCFFRHKSRNEEFTTQEVREKTVKELESVYNSEMDSLPTMYSGFHWSAVKPKPNLRKELDEMKRQLHEKSRVVNGESPSLSPKNRIPELAKEEKKSINGEHASRISGAAMAGSGSLNESQADDMQAANCVIS